MQYRYEIADEQIHIYKESENAAAYVYWPEELIRVVDEQGTAQRDPALVEILNELLEEYPELFSCDYNSDVVM